uniref:Uncharacterized protein n=1 Tax=Setaria digitata TaxID=48799 RepID=A0A915Q5X0_9BILA
MSTDEQKVASSVNLKNNLTDSYLINDGTDSLASCSVKDVVPLSESSDEAENSAMETLNYLIEQGSTLSDAVSSEKSIDRAILHH